MLDSKKIAFLTIFPLLFAILILVVFFGQKLSQKSYTEQDEQALEEKTYPSISDFPFYSISELKQSGFSSGNYNTEGFLVFRSYCPPCPPNVLCAPCPPSRIVISETSTLLPSKPTMNKTEEPTQLILFTLNPDQFVLGGKYKFSVRILDNKSTLDPLNDVEIVGYDLVE